jgi:hypothetical protein
VETKDKMLDSTQVATAGNKEVERRSWRLNSARDEPVWCFC